jgi:hypothetical protein
VIKGYTCRRCGQYHELPLSYGAEAPVSWFAIPEKQRGRRTVLSSDQCKIDDRYFFIVGNIDIPILGSDQLFRWSVWVSLSKQNYERTCVLWDRPGREAEPPYFGWLSTSLSPYPDTINLKTLVHTWSVGERPYVELESSDHPLAVEQQTGITLEPVQQIAEAILYGTQTG